MVQASEASEASSVSARTVLRACARASDRVPLGETPGRGTPRGLPSRLSPRGTIPASFYELVKRRFLYLQEAVARTIR